MSKESVRQRIVVGVDGSEESLEALRWAIDEANRRDATVDAVLAWDYPMVTGGPLGFGVLPGEPLEYEEAAEATLAHALAEVCEDDSSPPVMHVLTRGDAAQALITRADGADLLVVGSRGRGGFAGLLLGSVSQKVAHHCPCPTVVVRSEKVVEVEEAARRVK